MEKITREEHLAWCKNRALKYVELGRIEDAMASMSSDLRKHSETANHSAIGIGMMMLINGIIKTPAEMRKFIEGFN